MTQPQPDPDPQPEPPTGGPDTPGAVLDDDDMPHPLRAQDVTALLAQEIG